MSSNSSKQMTNYNKSPTVSLKAMQSNNSSPKTDNSKVDQLLVKTNNAKGISDEKTSIGSQNANINENKELKEIDVNQTKDESPEISFSPSPKSQKTESDSQKSPKKFICDQSMATTTNAYQPKRKFEPPLSSDILKGLDKSRQIMAEDNKDENDEKRETQTSDLPTLTTSSSLMANVKSSLEVVVGLSRKGVPAWMSKPKDLRPKDSKYKTTVGLEFIDKLRKFYIYDNITIFDNLFEEPNASRNCLTIRNADYQQVYYVGSVNNRTPGTMTAFTLKLVDQYNRHIISVRKHWKSCCFASHKIDIECPPGIRIGRMKQIRHFFGTVEFVITDQKTKNTKFFIRRQADTKYKQEFEIWTTKEMIGTIIKRFEKVSHKKHPNEDHYTRIGVPLNFRAEDKAIILSAGLIINFLYLRQLKRG